MIDKLWHLNKLNFKNKITILKYLLKRIFQLPNSSKDEGVYLYYNYLIKLDGQYINEIKDAYISSFKGIGNKNILLRKLPSSDMAVLDQVILHKGYLSLINLFNLEFYNDAKTELSIVDAGSNIGLTALFFKEYYPESRIICIEPDKENFKVLDYNLNDEFYKNINKLNGAVWSSNTKMEIINDFRDQLDWSIRVKPSNKVEAIEAFSINQIIQNYSLDRIDILKIDIEGAEKEIFTSKQSDLSFLNKTRCIAVEIHKEFNCELEIEDILKEYGFKTHKSGELTIGINQNQKPKILC